MNTPSPSLTVHELEQQLGFEPGGSRYAGQLDPTARYQLRSVPLADLAHITFAEHDTLSGAQWDARESQSFHTTYRDLEKQLRRDEADPIVLVLDDDGYHSDDGRHRLSIARAAKMRSIRAYVLDMRGRS